MYTKYTEQMDKVLGRYLVLYDDKKTAFDKFASSYGVTPKSAQNRYYRRRDYIDNYIESLKSCDIIPTPKPTFIERLWKVVKSMLNIQSKL